MEDFVGPNRMFVGIVLLMTAVACGTSDSPTTPTQPTDVLVGVEISSPRSSIMRGTTIQLTVFGRRASGGSSPVDATWQSTDPSIATVSSTGLVTAVSAGPTTISAIAEGFSANITLAVTNQAFTYLVYMAADNNLTFAGLGDLEELEAVGSSDSVNVVVQAEFSPTELGLFGLTSSDINRPNFNTFRYKVDQGSAVAGPDGPVVDIGPTDMSDPASLEDFIEWAEANYPADRFALVLWNHGGGFLGLIEDQTQGNGTMMSLTELRSALSGGGVRFDLIDFDMCLMGGIETALATEGYADHLVFSEELIPGAGNPYDRVVGQLRANPTMDGEALAATTVEEYMAEYSGGRASVTRSAFDLGRMEPLKVAWDGLARELSANLATYRSSLEQVIPQTQGYEYRYLRDMGDFALRLEQAGAPQPLAGHLEAVRSALSLAVTENQSFSAVSYEAQSVDGSTGLTVVLPSGGVDDQLPETGPGSLAAYSSTFPGVPWVTFLQAWLGGAPTRTMVDQGPNALQVALAWDTASVSAQVDVDLWVLEPSGNLYIPYLGVVTPNGTFSADSYETGGWFEMYFTRQFVEEGSYQFYADLWTDPNDHRPAYSVFSRLLGLSEWDALYSEPLPSLSKDVSWRDDPTPTLGEAQGGAYTDLEYVAVWTPASGPMAAANSRSGGMAAVQSNTPTPALTQEQWATLRRMDRTRGTAAPHGHDALGLSPLRRN